VDSVRVDSAVDSVIKVESAVDSVIKVESAVDSAMVEAVSEAATAEGAATSARTCSRSSLRSVAARWFGLNAPGRGLAPRECAPPTTSATTPWARSAARTLASSTGSANLGRATEGKNASNRSEVWALWEVKTIDMESEIKARGEFFENFYMNVGFLSTCIINRSLKLSKDPKFFVELFYIKLRI